jgi:hypothetical protein
LHCFVLHELRKSRLQHWLALKAPYETMGKVLAFYLIRMIASADQR